MAEQIGIDDTWFHNGVLPTNAVTTEDVLKTGAYFVQEGRLTNKSNGMLLVFNLNACVFQFFINYHGGMQTRMKWYEQWYDWKTVTT